MARAAVWESVTVAGRAERARVARAFTAGVLGPGHPCGEDVALLVSELLGNSVRHSGSGAAGQTVTVAVSAAGGVVRVEVTDRSGPGVSRLRASDGDTEDGRGLGLVAALAARWGWRRRGGRTVAGVRAAVRLNLRRPEAGGGGTAGRAEVYGRDTPGLCQVHRRRS